MYVFIIVVPVDIMSKRRKLDISCIKSIRKGNAPGTRANHRTHESAYVKFCQEYRYDPYPATEWRYCQFAQYLSDQNKVLGTCDNYVSTVRVVHRLQGLPFLPKGQIHYKMLSDGLKRQCTEPVKQAKPMTHDVLRKIIRAVDFTSELEVVAWIAVLVAFTLILRVSNIGPDVRKNFDRLQYFVRGDLTIKRGLYTMLNKWTKTLQYHNRIIESPIHTDLQSIKHRTRCQKEF